MKTLFLTMKKDFRLKKDILNLDTQIYLIELIENIIPVRKITKFGKNFRIEKTKSKKVTVETYDTLAED